MPANFDSLLFNIDMPKRTPAVGDLLVAEPFLRESYFNHAVVCLIHYGRDSDSMGIVLNKITNFNLSDLVNGITRPDPIPVYCGGPVGSDYLYFIHVLGDIIPEARPLGNGLYIGGSFDAMLDYINMDYPVEGVIRFYLGYSGWDTGQLDRELHDNVWAVANVSNPRQLLNGSDDALWHGQVKAMGDIYRGWLFHPQHPSLN